MAAMTIASAVILIAAGRFAPELTSDTPLYLNLPPYPDLLAHPRTPLYGWLVGLFDLEGNQPGCRPSRLPAMWRRPGFLSRSCGASACRGVPS